MASAKIVELNETNTCKICDNALARYSCPKCNILYCSLDCYQANSHLECSETFYKDNVMKEWNLNGGNEETKAKMLEILQRTHENNKISLSDDEDFSFEDISELDSDDEEYLDIGERLAGVDLDDAEEVWDKLTEDEKQEFVAFLKSEDITKLIPSWNPWWLFHSDHKIEDTEEKDNYKSNCPKLCDIQEFSKLTSKEPSECVKYNTINILCAYAFTARYFNGEHFDFPQESVSCIVALSLTLKVAQNFNDFDIAVKSIEQECVNSDWIVSDAENIQTMKEDLEKILRGPKKTDQNFYVLCALSDLHHLFENAVKPTRDNSGAFTKKFPNEHFPSVKLEAKEKIKSNIKKIEYYLAYAKDHFLDHIDT